MIESTIPPNIVTIINELEDLRKHIAESKKQTDYIIKAFNVMDKHLSRYLNRDIRNNAKKQVKKQKRGFAIPTDVSPELCNFMGLPVGSKVARTQATKFLNQYIKENNLFLPRHAPESSAQQYAPNNKKYRIIMPNETLWNILNPDAKRDDYLHVFSIQKYFGHHFIRNT